MAEHYLSHDCQYAFGGRHGGSSADSSIVITVFILRGSAALSLAGLGDLVASLIRFCRFSDLIYYKDMHSNDSDFLW